jgi:cell wall-associated NlpC family hydrolase
MRRTIRRTTRLTTIRLSKTRLTTALLAPALMASAIVVGMPVASAAPGLADETSRGSIHDDASRQAAADHRRKAQRERDALADGDVLREQVVERALAQVGDAYGSGGEGPNVFDCSGLVVYSWRAAGVKLTHYSRAQYEQTERISLKDAVPGDLAFYFENGAHHVAIYIGDGKVVHASDYGIGVVKGVVKGTPWTNAHFTGMGRVKIPG